jgi:AP-4 complex subunit beta-1
MNLLDPWLKVSNSAVVLATTKTFLKLTEHDADVQRQVYLRLKTPMLTVRPEWGCFRDFQAACV